jgi:hypothetical protein
MNKFCDVANTQYTTKFIPIDGDTMDLDNLEAMNFLGSEKNDYLNYLIVRQIIFGNVPVVSHGSFVFTKICDYVQDVIGIKPKLLLCEMINNDSSGDGIIPIIKLQNFINWTGDNADIYKIATKKALHQRYGQSIKEYNEGTDVRGWLFPNINTYKDTKKQEGVINELITRLFKSPNPKFDPINILNNNTEIIKYGCNLLNYSPSLEIDFGILFDDINTFIDNIRQIEPNKVKFKQLRYLVKYWKNGDDETPKTTATSVSFGHITLKYETTGIKLDTEIISNNQNFGEIRQCELVTAKSQNGLIISAIVLGKITKDVEKYNGVKYLDFIGTEEKPKYVHVTVKNGKHQPNLMNHFSELYLEGSTTVDMEYKDQDGSQLSLDYVYQPPTNYSIKYYKPYYV